MVAAFYGVKTDPQQLSKFILAEHPQTIALILGQLGENAFVGVVQTLHDDLHTTNCCGSQFRTINRW